MSGPSKRQPLGTLTTSPPRQFPRAPTPAPEPRPSSGWARFLQDSTGTRARRVQRLWPGIRPARGANQENDPYGYLERFTIRCGGSTHVARVHSTVVLHQSPWLRDEVARRRDPEVPVRTPGWIRWWQVAWALEYMYEGRVPGFNILAGEDMPSRYPRRHSRSITWGLVELWDVADFFGLEGLKRRAVAAFREYLSRGIRCGILCHRVALAPEPAQGLAGIAQGLARPENRIGHEFCQAAWRVFGGMQDEYTDYIDTIISCYGWPFTGRIAQDENALLQWESTVFDKAVAPDAEDFVLEDLVSLDLMPQSLTTFGPVIISLCMRFAPSGLFELRWFREFIPEHGPQQLRVALAQRMSEPDSSWPRDEYPGAPFNFDMVNPWRLIASNARAVPPASRLPDGRQEGAEEQEPIVQQ